MLPQGFTRVEYIESTGTQYIDTGFKPNQNTRVVIDARVLTLDNATSLGVALCSVVGSGYYYTLFVSNNGRIGSRFATFEIKHFEAGAPDWNVRQVYDKNRSETTVSNYTVTSSYTTFQMNHTLFLCARNNAGKADSYCVMRIYSTQIYEYDTIKYDLIPCINPDGEVGLYDNINSVFYGNLGTGVFVAGEVVNEENIPDAPASLEYTLTGNTVALTWDASSMAVSYRVYRDYAIIAEVEATEYVDIITDTPCAHVYAVAAANEYGSSGLSANVRIEVWGDTALDLIYDRTRKDVDDAKALISKYMRGEALDSYEQELWDKGLRGCYNTSDVNRVEYHTRELQSILNANGYNIRIDTKLWAKSDIMRYSDIVRYLGNIKSILDAFGRSPNAPGLPSIDRWIDYIAANDIEKILHVTRELIYGALEMFRRAGAFTAGNDYERQVIRRG